MIDYDSFSHCHHADIFFRFSRGSKRVKIEIEPKVLLYYQNATMEN